MSMLIVVNNTNVQMKTILKPNNTFKDYPIIDIMKDNKSMSFFKNN